MTPRRSYEVVVSGRVGPAVADSLAPLTLDAQNGETTISGEGLDAAMLSGVLRTIERVGLELVAVRSFVDGERARGPRRRAVDGESPKPGEASSPADA